MALVPGTIALRFAGGLNTKTDPKAVPTTQLMVLENGVFTRATSIVKRNGYEALSRSVLGSAEPMTGARRLARRGSELLALTDERAYSYLAGPDRWIDAGRVEAPVMTDRVIAKTGTEQVLGDSAALEGVRAAAWEDSRGGVWYAVLDDATGSIIRQPVQLHGSAERPRVVACGSMLHVYYAVAASGFVFCCPVNPHEPTAVLSPSLMITDLDPARPYYDAEPTPELGGSAIIAWVSGATSYRLGYVAPPGVMGAPVNGFPSIVTGSGTNIDTAIAVAYDAHASVSSAQIAVVTIDGGDLRYVVHDSATLAAGASSTVAITGSPVRLTAAWQRDDGAAGRVLWWAVEYAASTPRDHSVHVGSAELGNAPGFLALQRGAGLASRAFRDGGGTYVWLGHDTTYYSVAMCVRLGAAAPLQCVARALPGTWGGLAARSHLPGVWDGEGDDRSHCWTTTYAEQLEAEAGDQFAESGLRVVDLSWDDDASHQSAELGQCVYLAGAVMQQYDGARWAEAGYHYAPDEIIAAATAGGELTASRTYNYVVWYEETLATGEIDRGPVSMPVSVVLGIGQTRVTLTIPTLRLTGRRHVRICVGRTEANTPGTYCQVTSLDPGASTGSNRHIANDPTVDTVTFVDDLSDDALLARPYVYINGGVLENDPIPGGAIIAGGKNRLFVADPSSPHRLFHSQQLAEGYAAEFAPALTITLDPHGGAITGIAVMDDLVIVFKESAIYYVAGDGPFADPSLGGGWSTAMLITSDVGCVNGRSIESTPEGLVFQSTKGIYLLERGRSVRYVGAPVEAYNAQTIRSADLIRDTTQVRFLCDDGRTLLYDYLFQQWSTFTGHAGLDAVTVSGRYHYLRTDGTVYRETPGVYSDAGSPIKLRLETAWIKPGEILQQYMRVWYAVIIGERKSAHWFRCQFRTNYDVSWSDPEIGEFDATDEPGGEFDISAPGGTRYGVGNYGDGPYGGAPGLPVFQWQLHLGQACEAIQFRFEDRQITGQPGPSFELTELLLEVGLKARTYKGALPDTRSK